MHRALVLVALAACHPAEPPRVASTPREGLSISLYDSFALVDDRRSIDVRGRTLELEHIDPGAALASLVIEPLGDATRIQLGACTRDALPELAAEPQRPAAQPLGNPPLSLSPELRFRRRRVIDVGNGVTINDLAPAAPSVQAPSSRFAPVVRCTVDAPPGRYLVRVLYVSTALRYRAEHDVTMTAADRASIVSRFAVATPAWGVRADLAVFDGAPGGPHLPREIARGAAELDGSVAVLATPAREVTAQLHPMWQGAAAGTATDDSDADVDSELDHAVWIWLELASGKLVAGPVMVHVELPGGDPRDAVIAPARREQTDALDAPLRLPLWVDPTLHAYRQRTVVPALDSEISDRFLITIANLGDAPREVWVEERLRPLRHHRFEHAWPGKPVFVGDRVRAKLFVKPGKLERVGFSILYGSATGS